MKKLLVFVLVVALAASSLFAINGHGGIKMGPSFSWYNLKPEGSSEGLSLDKTSFAIDVEGATYFNEGKNQFGVGYGMRFDMPIVMKQNGVEVPKEMKFDFGFAPQVSFQYKYVMNEKLALEAGAGMSWVFYNKDMDMGEGMPAGVKATLKLNTFSLLANVGVSYKFTNLVGLRAGVELSTPLTYNMKYEVTGIPEGYPDMSDPMKTSVYGIAVTPYIGVSVFY